MMRMMRMVMIVVLLINIHFECPLSEIPKSENLQDSKLLARLHERNAVQM
jgi:hypothetical protein